MAPLRVAVLDRRFPEVRYDPVVERRALARALQFDTATGDHHHQEDGSDDSPLIECDSLQFTCRDDVLRAFQMARERFWQQQVTEISEIHGSTTPASGAGAEESSAGDSAAADADAEETDDAMSLLRFLAVDVLLAWHHVVPIDAEVMACFPRLRGIVRLGAGTDNVDFDAAAQRGIRVANVPDYGVDEVADAAMWLLVGTVRRLFTSALATQARLNGGLVSAGWAMQAATQARRISELKLGIVGLGRIGSALVRRALAAGMEVVCFDPFAPRGLEKSLGVSRRFESLHAMLEVCDVVSLHLPLRFGGQDNTGLMDAQAFAHMRPGSFLINTARGGVVDPDALCAALDSGRLAGAGLDVLDHEPYSLDGPLRQFENVIMTPHVAFYSQQSVNEMVTKGAQEAARLLLGHPLWYDCADYGRDASAKPGHTDTWAVVPGDPESRVVMFVPHAGTGLPPSVRDALLLGDKHLATELVHMTDAHTDAIAYLSAERCQRRPWLFINKLSRLVVDPERFPDDREEMNGVGMGAVYSKTAYQEENLRDPNSFDDVAASLIAQYFSPISAAINDLVTERLKATGAVTLIDVHSYSAKVLPYEVHQRDARPQVCIGTDAAHTPSSLVRAAREALDSQHLQSEVDQPFKGTYVPTSMFGNPNVSSIMFEIRRDVYQSRPGSEAQARGTRAICSALAAVVDACAS